MASPTGRLDVPAPCAAVGRAGDAEDNRLPEPGGQNPALVLVAGVSVLVPGVVPPRHHDAACAS
jgi:hypothetical protein